MAEIFYDTLSSLANALAYSENFQSFLGVETSAAALEKIHYLKKDIDEANDFPLAAVLYDDFTQERDGVAGGDLAMDTDRELLIVLIDKKDNTPANQRAFLQSAGLIRQDLVKQCVATNTGGYPILSQISLGGDMNHDPEANTFEFAWKITLGT